MGQSGHPAGPFLVVLFGGILILSQGILEIVAGGVAVAAQLNALGQALGGLGFVESFLGVVLILLATALFLDPRIPFVYGVVIIVLSAASLFEGGGFLLGLALGVAGGGWALWVRPSGSEQPVARGAPVWRDQQCARCGRLYTGSAAACPFCGAVSVPARRPA